MEWEVKEEVIWDQEIWWIMREALLQWELEEVEAKCKCIQEICKIDILLKKIEQEEEEDQCMTKITWTKELEAIEEDWQMMVTVEVEVKISKDQ